LLDANIVLNARFANNSLRCKNRVELDAAVAAAFAKCDAATLIERFETAGTAWARLNGVDGLSSHSQLRRVSVGTPTGPVSLPASPVRWDGEMPFAAAVPAVGENDAAIRAEFS